MKIYLPLFLIFFSVNYWCLGQNKTFVNPRNTWSLYTYAWFNPESYSHARFSDQVTVINGREYRELLFENEKLPGWSGYSRFFREENGRVYSITGVKNEVLVYDFTIEKGDSLVYQEFNYSTKMKVDSVDTIVTLDGVQRKRLFLSMYCQGLFAEKTVWIEGIGDIDTRTFNSMDFKCIIADPETTLICFYVDNLPVLNDWGCRNNLEGYLNMVDWRYIWQVDRQSAALPPSMRLYRFSGQKEINGKVYTQLQHADNILPVSVPWTPSGKYFRYENGKLLKNADTTEHVVMDFSLIQGDSITINHHGSLLKIFILKTDTVIYKDNVPRKRLYLGCNSDDEPALDRVWVYGLGDISIFLDYPQLECSLFEPETIDEVVCILYYNYYDIYKAPGVLGCFKAATRPDETSQKPTILVYPNPASDLVTFSADVPLAGTLLIQHLDGRTAVKQNWPLSSESMEVNISGLLPGFYIYTLSNKSGRSYSGKLIVR